MRKIAFYCPCLAKGGAERVLINLAESFSNLGYSVVLITSSLGMNEYPYSSTIPRLILDDFYPHGKNRIVRLVKRIGALRKIIKEQDVGVIVSFLSIYHAIIASSFLPKVKCIVSIRNDPKHLYKRLSSRIVAKMLVPLADGCVFQTAEAASWFSNYVKKKSVVIFNPIKKSFFLVEPRPEPNLVVSCARLEPQKSQRVLIAAFAKACMKNNELKLRIYGDGSERANLEKQIIELGIEGKVSLMGASDNVPEVLKSASIFVMSSSYEGMPNALMEALAAGIPSISTDCPCGGPRVLLGENENGILVPVGDIDALASAILKLSGSKELQMEFSRKGKEEAEKYTSEKIVKQWEDFMIEEAEKQFYL